MNSKKQLAATLACLYAVTACGGQPDPEQMKSPAVSQPLDIETYRGNVCGLLSDTGSQDMGFTVSRRDEAADRVGPQCSWSAEESYNHLGIVVRDDWPHGLSDLYARKDSLGYFEPVSLAGYPAVFAAERDERQSVGSCVLSVGISDQVALWFQFVAVRESDVAASCSTVRKAAEMALATIKQPA